MLHVSHDTHDIFGWRMKAEWSEQGDRKFSSFIIPWYFQNVVGFAAVLHIQSKFVFRIHERKWKSFLTLREEIITENRLLYRSSGISDVLCSPHIDCFYSVAGVALQLETASHCKLTWIKYLWYCLFLNSYTITNTQFICFEGSTNCEYIYMVSVLCKW